MALTGAVVVEAWDSCLPAGSLVGVLDDPCRLSRLLARLGVDEGNNLEDIVVVVAAVVDGLQDSQAHSVE